MDSIRDILSFIKDESLMRFAKNHQFYTYNTKLQGELIFKGLMKLILSGRKTSLRLLETMMNQSFGTRVTFSGLSKILNNINTGYFKSIKIMGRNTYFSLRMRLKRRQTLTLKALWALMPSTAADTTFLVLRSLQNFKGLSGTRSESLYSGKRSPG